jgi:DNA-binding MarR family transcriptional regulator
VRAGTQESIAESIRQYRRVVWRDMIENTFRGRSTFEISSLQLMTLFLLEDGGSLSLKKTAASLGRSLSAASRMIDDMVEKGWVRRVEDENDRRSKQLSLTREGRAFLNALETRRVNAQISLIKELAPAEQELVGRAMHLLAEAARRRSDV